MIPGKIPVLHTSNLQIGYYGNAQRQTLVADHINVDLYPGELICLLGPNGSGKSTLIRTLAGIHPRLEGDFSLFGDDIDKLTHKDIAKHLSTVLTDRITVGNLTVYALVAFGRSPYTGWLGSLSREDEEIVRWAIQVTGLADFVWRDIRKLSDGERQKVMIARALAQDTSVILLDEPTAHLDLPNRVEIVRLLRRLAHDTGKGILMSTHELDLALKAADRIWLMSSKRELLSGVPEDLVLDGTFEEVFHQDSFDFDRTTGSFNLHEQQGRSISLSGDAVSVFWTKRALEREGYQVIEGDKENYHVEVQEEATGLLLAISGGEYFYTAHSIREMIMILRKIRNDDGPESQ